MHPLQAGMTPFCYLSKLFQRGKNNLQLPRLVWSTSISTSHRESKGLWDCIIKHSALFPHTLGFSNISENACFGGALQFKQCFLTNENAAGRRNSGELESGDRYFVHFRQFQVIVYLLRQIEHSNLKRNLKPKGKEKLKVFVISHVLAHFIYYLISLTTANKQQCLKSLMSYVKLL